MGENKHLKSVLRHLTRLREELGEDEKSVLDGMVEGHAFRFEPDPNAAQPRFAEPRAAEPRAAQPRFTGGDDDEVQAHAFEAAPRAAQPKVVFDPKAMEYKIEMP